MERFGFLSKSFCIFVLSYFKTVKSMYKEELKGIFHICDDINEFLEKILIESYSQQCSRYLSFALIFTEKVQEFMYVNFHFFDSMLFIDGLIDDLKLFQDNDSIEDIKSISQKCIYQLNLVRYDLVNSELIYDKLNK